MLLKDSYNEDDEIDKTETDEIFQQTLYKFLFM